MLSTHSITKTMPTTNLCSCDYIGSDLASVSSICQQTIFTMDRTVSILSDDQSTMAVLAAFYTIPPFFTQVFVSTVNSHRRFSAFLIFAGNESIYGSLFLAGLQGLTKLVKHKLLLGQASILFLVIQDCIGQSPIFQLSALSSAISVEMEKFQCKIKILPYIALYCIKKQHSFFMVLNSLIIIITVLHECTLLRSSIHQRNYNNHTEQCPHTMIVLDTLMQTNNNWTIIM